MTDHEKLLVKCEEEGAPHPHCPHGPMLYFYRQSSPYGGYFACSALRSKKFCSCHINYKDLSNALMQKRYPIDMSAFTDTREEMLLTLKKNRRYCLTCKTACVNSKIETHLGHDVLERITSDMYTNPTTILNPLENDKVEAQYLFEDKTLKFFFSCLRKLKVKKVVCMGAPRLHEYLKNLSINTFLLDFDHRYLYFYKDKHFAWYNMCNNHFFSEDQRHAFENFLTTDKDEVLAIFTDPPFGCRTEVIANTIKQLTNLYRSLNHHLGVPIVFWVFPYFSEHYIKESMPELEMCEYKINYVNHESYSEGEKGRKLGSPVRFFTNVPLHMIPLPSPGYKFCIHCNRWTAVENHHCFKCKVCPSKNGATYRHCSECRICVKPNYFHCKACLRCTQKENHNCVEYQRKIRCRICNETGHNEHNCRSFDELPNPKC